MIGRSTAGKFWRNWYQGYLSGQPLEWDLQTRVAQVSGRYWSKGLEIVAAEIQAIEAKFNFEVQVANFLQTLDTAHVEKNRLGIGGNHPPEGMQIAPDIIHETTLIITYVRDLGTETAKQSPEKGRVQEIIKALQSALRQILVWTLKKGNLSIETLIKWGVPAGLAAALANTEIVAAIIKAAQDLLPFL